MKKNLLFVCGLLGAQVLFAQTPQKTFDLYAVAEGNFGTPNGDVFLESTHANPPVTASGGLYQAANATAGFDVLQEFEIAGAKAMFASKPANGNYRLTITAFPSFTLQASIPIAPPTALVKASSATAYLCTGQPTAVEKVNLVNNTLSTVNDPSDYITSYSEHMVCANGFLYLESGGKIVKVDTLTNTAVGVIQPGVGGIKGLVYDDVNHSLWALGASGGSAAVIKIDITNNDFLNAPVQFAGISSARMLRYANGKLYFWKDKNMYVYNIANPVLPLTVAYTSPLTGSWDFGYGRSFGVDPQSGDFTVASANGFTGPSLYEVVDGTSFTQIASGSVAGCTGANKLYLKTYPAAQAPVPDVATLPNVQQQCSATLTAPTANGGTVTATTADPVNYTQQGTYTITWTYTNAGGTATQTQTVTVDDNTNPVPDVAGLPVLNVSCPYTLIAPTATDNCAGVLTAATTSPLTYTTAGNNTITWTYNDGNGNTATQTQTLNVSCSTAGIDEGLAMETFVYPNPSTGTVNVRIQNPGGQAVLNILNQVGQEVKRINITTDEFSLDLNDFANGIYYYSVTVNGQQKNAPRKIVLSR